MTDEENKPSAQTQALLERTRAAKAAQGEAAKTVTVIEDAKPVKKPKAAQEQPPADNAHVAPGAEQFAQTPVAPTLQKPAPMPDPQASQPEVSVQNDEFKVKTRTMSRTEAEQERGRQIIEKNQAARRRAEAAQRESDENGRG